MFTGIVNGTSFDNLKSRLIKFIGYGTNDVKNQPEAMPYGLDSNPVKNMTAIYVQNVSGQLVVIGYININQLADVGEFRTYATDKDGNLQGSVWLKNNGDVNIVAQGNSTKIKLNQGSSNAVLGDKLNTTLNDIVTVLTAINAWGITVAPVPLPTQAVTIAQIITDINQIQSQNVSLD